MKTICFIVPYFGVLPSYFKIWLSSCALNDSINWLIFTNDRTSYDYPFNVTVEYMDFEEMQGLIKSKFDFDIIIDTPYKLCDYKIAYGDIFSDYIKNYDFWGFCDIDLIWGNIRKFYTPELLNKYDKIGNQGHATIFRNDESVNKRYKIDLKTNNYINAFCTSTIVCTDVVLINQIYKTFHFPAYTATNYAGLEKYEPGFFLQAKPTEEAWKNNRQVFLWDHGELTRYYINRNGLVETEDYLYIHFFCRPMKNKIEKMDRILIYPDVYINYYENITSQLVQKLGKKSKIAYYIRVFKQNRNRLSLKKIHSYFKTKHKYKKLVRNK